MFNAQTIVLNERQVGAAIEGVLRQEEIEIVQLAVDTRGYEVPIHWDQCVHLIASAYSSQTSAINVLARFSSAARGEATNALKRLIYTGRFANYRMLLR